MALSKHKQEQIAWAVIKVLYTRFNSFPAQDDVGRNAPFHEAFLNAFQDKLNGRVKDIPDFISLSSWMHGLNTSLGQSFFESVAHILCDGQKQEFAPTDIPSKQLSTIAEIMTDLKNGDRTPNVQSEYKDIIEGWDNIQEVKKSPKFTADCFYETSTDVVAIELKSVRPNSGEMRGEKQKVLIGKAVLHKLYPNKNIKYIFGFPFDPTASTAVEYDKQRFLESLVEAEKFIAQDDFLIADELWSFLASAMNGTMAEILEIINRIATPRFMDIYKHISKYQHTTEEIKIYKPIFENWYLYSEVDIMDKIVRTTDNERIFNQSVFKTDGNYNQKRLELLK